MTGTTISRASGSLRIDIANVTDTDAAFIRGVIAIFTDPAEAMQRRALRRGTISLRQDALTGACCVQDDSEPQHRNN